MWSFIKICLICIIGIYRLKENFTEKPGIYVKLLYNNIGCDDDGEEVDSDDMEYTEDAIDNMILEFRL
jgi:hypothetical protein